MPAAENKVQDYIYIPTCANICKNTYFKRRGNEFKRKQRAKTKGRKWWKQCNIPLL